MKKEAPPLNMTVDLGNYARGKNHPMTAQTNMRKGKYNRIKTNQGTMSATDQYGELGVAGKREPTTYIVNNLGDVGVNPGSTILDQA